MAMTPESKVKKKIRAALDAFGEVVYYAMPVGSGYGNSGVPDFVVCANGCFVGIEAKAGRGRTTALQDLHLANIRKAGGTTLVVNEDNVDRIAQILRGIIDCTALVKGP